MNKKQMGFCLLIFLLLSTAASAQQATKANIQVLEVKITSLENTVKEMDKRLTNQISELDKRLTAQIQATQTTMVEMDKRLSSQIQATQTTIVEMDKRLTNQINELDKRLSSQIKVLFWAIGALIGVVLAVIALPQLLGYFKDKQERADLKKMIEDLRQRDEQQQREIEELRRKLVMPS